MPKKVVKKKPDQPKRIHGTNGHGTIEIICPAYRKVRIVRGEIGGQWLVGRPKHGGKPK